MLACAQPQQQSRTIEPTIEPGAGGGGTIEPGVTQEPVDETEFVLSRDPVTTPARADFPIHLEDKWYPFRAEYLGITKQQARLRDQKIGSQPPAKFWDQQTAIEAVSIWSSLCNECHGGRRALKDALEMTAPPDGWGKGEGLFFGNKKPYSEIFGTIFKGGPPVNGKPSEMPEWGKRLSREQIWSLIYFLEFQSGGIEGRFPPSLYPRRPSAISD